MRSLTVFLLATTAVSLPTGSFAQNFDEIVVTARKKEERLQEVPISIAAISAEQMEALGIRSDEDVANFTPNFSQVRRVGRTEDRPVIRGMASPPDKGEANASYFIDGVFVSGSISTATTSSMERVEVLRGPQSAQFGRATFSGAVNYVTRQPRSDLEGSINARYGSSDERQLAGWVSGPIIEDKLLFLASAARDEYGGQWRNNLKPDSAFVNGSLFTNAFAGQSTEGDNSKLGEQATTDLLLKLNWKPWNATDITVKYSYTEGDDSLYPTNVRPNGDEPFANLNCYIPNDPGQPWYETSRGEYCGEISARGTENRKNIPDLRNGMTANTPLSPALSEDARTAEPVEPGVRRKTDRWLGELVQGLGDWTLTLRASYSEDSLDNVMDLDQQEVRAIWNLFLFHLRDEVDDTSFEVSVSSPVDNRVRGKIGAYWFSRDETSIERSFTGPAAVFGLEPGGNFGEPRIKETENVSIFGSLGMDLAPKWTLDVEARYAEDDKDIIGGQRSAIDNEPQPTYTSLDFSNFTPRVTLSYQPNDDLMFYGLVAKGNKPGDFNEDFYRGNIPSEFTEFQLNCEIGDVLAVAGVAPFECTQQLKDDLIVAEEEQWTYEVGFKSTWPEQSILLNVSAFYIDWKDQALSELTPVPGANGTTSTVQVLRNTGQSRIMGLEVESSWAPTDRLSLFLNYGLADAEFTDGFSPNFAAATGTSGDISGKQLPDTPKHSIVVGFEATAPAPGGMTAFLRGDASRDSRVYTRASNLSWVGETALVNLRAGLMGDAWTATFYVRNLLDDDTPITDFGFTNYAIDPIFTTPGAENDSTITAVYPLLYGVIPRPGRDIGIEFQYRFGT